MTASKKKLLIPTGKIMGAAKAKQARHPVKVQRPQILSAARKAVEAGKLPPVLKFQSEQNYSYNAHGSAMHAMAKAGDRNGLLAYEIKGTNTYARALAGYRDLLLQIVKAPAKSAAKRKAVKA